jgi:hypothetical protein
MKTAIQKTVQSGSCKKNKTNLYGRVGKNSDAITLYPPPFFYMISRTIKAKKQSLLIWPFSE